jgi:hypothetical protein
VAAGRNRKIHVDVASGALEDELEIEIDLAHGYGRGRCGMGNDVQR